MCEMYFKMINRYRRIIKLKKIPNFHNILIFYVVEIIELELIYD